MAVGASMEKISGEMERAELQKKNLFKVYEQVQSQASSVLLFTLRWKDLEERFDSIRSSLESWAKELDVSERALVEQARQVASREAGLRSAWQRVEECEEEVRRKSMDLRSVETRLEECRDEHRRKESELVLKRDEIAECDSLIKDKQKELHFVMQATDERRKDYYLKEEQVELLRQELDLKEKKVGSVQCLLEENAREVDAKAENLGSLKRTLEEFSRAVELKREELTMVHSQLDHSLGACEQSEKRLRLLEHTVKECDEKITMKARELHSLEDKIKVCQNVLEVKEEELRGIRTSIEKRSKELESKESRLHSINVLIEEREEELKSKKREFEEVNGLINERLMALALKGRELGSIEISIAKLSKEFKIKEGELEIMMKRVKHCKEETQSKKENPVSVQAKLNCAKVLEFQKQQCNLMQETITACSSVVNPALPTVPSRIDLQLLNENAMICQQISCALKSSSDPAQLVLGVFTGSYTQYSNIMDLNLETNILRRSQIVLLEQLLRISPLITHEVKEGATKLAREWKAKLSDKLENILEVLAFQHFLAAYKLVSLLNDSEIPKLAEIIAKNNDTPQWSQTLGLVDEITAHQLAYLLLSPESIGNHPD